MDHLRREQLPAEPALALRGGQHDVAEMTLEAVERRARGFGCRSKPGHHRGRGRVAGGGSLLALREGVVDQLGDARPLRDCLLRVETGDGPVTRADRGTRPVEHRRQPFEPARDRRQPRVQRRELPGDQGEEPIAEHVDPLERAPGLLPLNRLAEPVGRHLADQQVAVDPLVRLEVGVGERGELGRPSVVESQPPFGTGLRHVRPFGVVGMHPGRRRGQRMKREVFGEEGVGASGEVGHGRAPSASVGCRVYRPRATTLLECRTIRTWPHPRDSSP